MGRTDALDGQLHDHRAALSKLAGFLVSGRDSEDLVQETMMAAVTRSQPPTRWGPWLRKVIRNRAADRSRALARRQRREAQAFVDVSSDDQPDEAIFREQVTAALLRALERLEDPYRTTIRLRFYNEYSFREIAQATECKLATARWRLHEGLRRLRLGMDEIFEGRTQWTAALMILPGAEPTLERRCRVDASQGTPARVSLRRAVSVAGYGAVASCAIGAVFALDEPKRLPMGATTAVQSKGQAHRSTPATTSKAIETATQVSPLVSDFVSRTPKTPLFVGMGGGAAMPNCSSLFDPADHGGPLQLVEYWFYGPDGDIQLTIEATSGCYEEDLCGAIERPQCTPSVQPTQHPEVADCFHAQLIEEGPPEHFFAHEDGHNHAEEGLRHVRWFGDVEEPHASTTIDTEIPDTHKPINLANLPARGAETASFTIYACADYLHHSEQARPTLDALLHRNPRVELRWLHYPATGDRGAIIKALAAISAGRQGQFWAMHDALFDLPTGPQNEELLDVARDIGLERDRFIHDLNSPESRERLGRQWAWCRAHSPTGAPSFVLGDELVAGALALPVFQETLDLARP